MKANQKAPKRENRHEEIRDGAEERVYRKPGKGRIAFRLTAAFLSLLFFLSASGLLYVENLLAGMVEEEIEGTMENPSSQLELPEIGEIPVESETENESVESATESSGTKSEAVKVNVFKKFQEGYELVQGTPVLNDANIRNILLIGTDANGIGDATILLSINHQTKKIHLTSIMRAMYVNIPGNGWFMFNHAYSWGGTNKLMQTIEKNFRVKVDEYIVVNFNSFPKVIDVVGGVSVYLTQKEADYLNKLNPVRNFTAGVQHLNGGDALEYTRIRKIGSDFTRTERQRKVITALIRQAVSSGAGTLNELAVTLTSMVRTNLSSAEIVSLAAKAGTYAGYQIDQMMLPYENDTSGGHEPTFYGLSRIPYYNAPSIYVEVYTFDYAKNVNRLQNFLRS